MGRTVIGEAIITGQAPDGKFTPFASTQPVQASGVLTSDNTNVSDGDTVTIGAKVYTFKTSLASTFTSGQVLIGGSADASLTNLAAAINGSGGAVYYALGPDPNVTSSSVSSHALTITAKTGESTSAALGNNIGTTTTATHLSWGAAALSGGAAGQLAIAVESNIASVTPHAVLLGASASQVIPSGAKGWTVSILTGTGTVGGAAVPVGFSDNDTNTLAASLTVATDSASSAYVRWNT